MTLVLLTSCGKCCVSKLREAAETWLRRPRKNTRKLERILLWWPQFLYKLKNNTDLSSIRCHISQKQNTNTRSHGCLVDAGYLQLSDSHVYGNLRRKRHARARKSSLSQEDQLTWRLSRKMRPASLTPSLRPAFLRKICTALAVSLTTIRAPRLSTGKWPQKRAWIPRCNLALHWVLHWPVLRNRYSRRNPK